MSFSKKVFNHTAHMEMWNWLAENPGKGKKDWPGWKCYDSDMDDYFYCFACRSAGHSFAESGFDSVDAHAWYCVDKCPLEWGEAEEECCWIEDYGLYERWALTQNTGGKQELAIRIADLPVKSGVECI